MDFFGLPGDFNSIGGIAINGLDFQKLYPCGLFFSIKQRILSFWIISTAFDWKNLKIFSIFSVAFLVTPYIERDSKTGISTHVQYNATFGDPLDEEL